MNGFTKSFKRFKFFLCNRKHRENRDSERDRRDEHDSVDFHRAGHFQHKNISSHSGLQQCTIFKWFTYNSNQINVDGS